MLLAGFESWSSGDQSDRCTNFATTTALDEITAWL